MLSKLTYLTLRRSIQLLAMLAHGLLEEPTGGVSVSSGGHEHVDDLPELVDRPVGVAPPPADLHVGLIDAPAITYGVSARAGGLGQQWCESLHQR